MSNKPLKYLILGLLAGVVSCHAAGIQPLVPTHGVSVTGTAGERSSEVAVTVRWPYRAQVIPTSSQHLEFQLNGASPQTLAVPRPDGTSPTSVATMSVDVGTGYTMTVRAYDNAPTPRLVASGTSLTFDVRANERTDVTVALQPVYTPTVTGFSPTNGGPGASVEIYGTNFGQDRGLTPGFTFNGVAVTTVYPPQDGTVSVLVPTTAVSGLVLPKVDGVTGTGASRFTVLKELAIAPASQTLASGSSVVFTALATTSENTAFSSSPAVTWSVSAPLSSTAFTNYRIQNNGDGLPDTSTSSVSLGTIDPQGHFTATATGSGQITILSGTLIATAAITVTP